METNAREFAGKYVKVEGKKVKVPAFSDWDQKCDCCGCKVAYFPEIDAYFCNQWECQFKYPAFVLSVVIISLFFAIWSVIDLFSGTNRIIILSVFGVIFIFWIISYFCAMCRSPGYLPWYWAVQKGTQYSYQEQMDGVITTEEQKDFAAQFSKPERGSLTKKGRRIILRADHICPWIANWVGLKNYRYFFTKLVWTLILFIAWFVIYGFVVADMVKNGWKTNVTNISMIICFVPVILFFIFFFIVFQRHIRYLCTNMTTLQELKMDQEHDTENPYNLGCWNNCSETLGPKYCCLLWFIPVPLPRMNAGIFWHRNDEEDSDDVAAEIKRRAVVYADELNENACSSESEQSSPTSEDEVLELENLDPIQAPESEPVPEPVKIAEPSIPTPVFPTQVKKESPKKKEKLHMIGIKTDEVLEDNMTATRTIEEHRKVRMRIYDPEKDEGKKVYKKVKMPKKLAEERERLKAEGKDYHHIKSPKNNNKKKVKLPKQLPPKRKLDDIENVDNTVDSNIPTNESKQSTVDRMPSIPSTVDDKQETIKTMESKQSTTIDRMPSIPTGEPDTATMTEDPVSSTVTIEKPHSTRKRGKSSRTSARSTIDRLPSIPGSTVTETQTNTATMNDDDDDFDFDNASNRPHSKRSRPKKKSKASRLPSVPTKV